MTVVQEFTCQKCGERFQMAPEILSRYPGWNPKLCLGCRKAAKRPDRPGRPRMSPEAPADDPQTGVFTDGFCKPNPGVGGWGTVKVADGDVVKELWGSERDTTNNRMELRALIEGLKLLHEHEEMSVFSDSQLCVNTATKWAAEWARNGWRRGKKREEVSNLDLVQELHEVVRSRPKADIQWIKAHAGFRWNEYADRLSSRFLQEPLRRD
jgi:ribonuclease HI